MTSVCLFYIYYCRYRTNLSLLGIFGQNYSFTYFLMEKVYLALLLLLSFHFFFVEKCLFQWILQKLSVLYGISAQNYHIPYPTDLKTSRVQIRHFSVSLYRDQLLLFGHLILMFPHDNPGLGTRAYCFANKWPENGFPTWKRSLDFRVLHKPFFFYLPVLK